MERETFYVHDSVNDFVYIYLEDLVIVEETIKINESINLDIKSPDDEMDRLCDDILDLSIQPKCRKVPICVGLEIQNARKNLNFDQDKVSIYVHETEFGLRIFLDKTPEYDEKEECGQKYICIYKNQNKISFIDILKS